MAEPSGSSSSSGFILPAKAGGPPHLPYDVAGLPAKEQLKPVSGKRTLPPETDPSEVESLAADPPKTPKSQKTDRSSSPGGRAAEVGMGKMMALPPSDMSDPAGIPGNVLSKRFVSHALVGTVQHDGPPHGESDKRQAPDCCRLAEDDS